eukprot:3717702-Rhodomonas_salina.4
MDLIPREADKTGLKCKELRINEKVGRMTSGMRSAEVLRCCRCLPFCGLATLRGWGVGEGPILIETCIFLDLVLRPLIR